MKKVSLLLLVTVYAVCLNAQIIDFEIVSSKTYENNTSTTYLTLVGDFDKTLCDEIVSDLESYQEISKFSFYDKSNLMKCMFTADISFNAEIIVQLINDIVENRVNGSSSEFVNVWVNSTGYEIFFQLENIASDVQRRQIEEVLMKDSQIVSAVVNADGCKIIVNQKLSPEYVQIILNKFNVKIRPDSFK